MFKNLLLCLLSAGLFSACQQEELSDVSDFERNVTQSPEKNWETSELRNIATMLCKVQIDTSVCREVHEACTKALENGMDETYRFSELLHPTLTTRSTATPNLGARINRYFAAPFIRSVQEASIDLKALAASKVQIYWPYSEDWDGKTLPLISFAPKDENQEWNIAYKFDDQGVIVDSIMVNEESMMQRPIWIINNSDRDRVLSTT